MPGGVITIAMLINLPSGVAYMYQALEPVVIVKAFITVYNTA